MRLCHLLLAGALAVSPAATQDVRPSSPSGTQSSESATQSSGQVTGAQSSGTTNAPSLPVSLEHIREGLKRQATESLLKKAEIPADFRVHIIEQQKLDAMLSKLDFKSGVGPIPAGGVYAYEQQRRLFNPVDNPLAQPYSAFSGRELITIALENLLARYLGGALVDGISDAERARAERAAREEVERDINTYCRRHPDRMRIELCTRSILR
jgi:hypothetical protein